MIWLLAAFGIVCLICTVGVFVDVWLEEQPEVEPKRRAS